MNVRFVEFVTTGSEDVFHHSLSQYLSITWNRVVDLEYSEYYFSVISLHLKLKFNSTYSPSIIVQFHEITMNYSLVHNCNSELQFAELQHGTIRLFVQRHPFLYSFLCFIWN